MRVFSFIEECGELIPVEVEVALWPGLPVIHFLGLADHHLKESALRIKSAIKASGYQFPVAQQIMVNLRPTHLKKSSRGIELAVAAAYLWESGQVAAPLIDQSFFVYGELTLFGDVAIPDDIRRIQGDHLTVLTGPSQGGSFPFSRWTVKNLRALGQPELISAEPRPHAIQRPSLQLLFHQVEAELLAILATGGHHVLLAGPQGSGKSTLARALLALLPEPSQKEMDLIHKLNPEETWRPLIDPHHSTPRMSMLGGGSSPLPGEIARAHRGLLLLDEFLEFDPHVLESLREPFEQGQLRIARLKEVKTYPAQSQIVGTTNLCPCGIYVPGEPRTERCRYSLKKCRSYAERLSGPLLDRFHVVHFTAKAAERNITADEILARVENGHAFRRARGQTQLNRSLTEKDILPLLDSGARALGASAQRLSQRRQLATLRVARSLADLERASHVNLRHLDRAAQWTITPFDQLSRWD
ncbi:MAG: competence protein ComM [Bdellovibrio sp.]|nr:MAG: competence protein ComM [Bdellovibrio sp.]